MAIANITNNILTDSGTLISSLATSATTISTTAPLQGGGDLSANRTLSITQSGTASNGYLSSTDWNTFNGKGSGTVTSVAALTIGTSGTDLSSSVANSTTTPVITLNVPTASATNRGALSSADWSTFNNKQSALTNPVLASGTWTSGYLPKINGTYTIGNSIVQDDATTVTIGGQLYVNRNDSNVIKVARNGGSNLNTVIEFANASSSVHIGSNGTLFGLGGTTGSVAAQPFIIVPSSSEKLRLDASGNLGLGVTPSAWLNVKAFQIGSTSLGNFSNTAYFNGNSYYASGTGWTYVNSSYAARYELNSGDAGIHAWFTAPSGTAGNAITFTQAMTLTASGRLLINKINEETYQLDVNGTGRFSGNLTAPNLYAGSGTGAPSVQVFGGASSNSIGGSAYITLQDVTNTRFWGIQADASQKLNFWHYNGGWSSVANIASTGAATFSSSVTALQLYTTNALALQAQFNSTTNNPYIRFDESSNAKFFIGQRAAVSGSGGVGYDFYSVAGNDIRFFTGGSSTTALCIDTSRNVGIGTSSPARIIHTYGSGAGAEWILEDSASSANVKKFNVLVSSGLTQFRALNDANNGGTIWLTANNSSGNVGIGTSTDYSSKLTIIPSSNPTSSTGSNNQISIGETSNNTGYCLKVGYINTGGGYQGSIQSIAGGSGSTLFLNASGGNVLIGTTTDNGQKLQVQGNSTVWWNNDVFVGMQYIDGSEYRNGFLFSSDNRSTGIIAKAATGSNPYIWFGTGITPTERMRITSGGNVGIGDSGSSNVRLQIKTGGNTSASYAIIVRNSSNSDLFFVRDDAATQFFSSVTATSFFESSDSRLKTLIQDNYQTKGIASITPKLYTKNGKVELGYYAQDFVGILDSAVSKGSNDMLSLSYREVLVAKVYALEQEIKELKAKMN